MKNVIRVHRAVHRLSQADLADAVGVSRQAINAIENDKHDPSVTLAFRIAAVFGQEITEVFQPEPDKGGEQKDDS